MTDQGVMRVDLIDGREIHGVDRGGKLGVVLQAWIVYSSCAIREIGSFRRLPAQWSEGIQVPDQEEDTVTRVE